MSVSHYQAATEQLIERMIPQYDASKTMKNTDVKQLLLRNLLLVGLRHKDVLKQCQNLKSDICIADHILNLARQAEYRDTTTLRLTKTVTTDYQHRRMRFKTPPGHRAIRSTKEDRRQVNRMTHPIPEDLHNADGVEDPDCADVTSV